MDKFGYVYVIYEGYEWLKDYFFIFVFDEEGDFVCVFGFEF